MINLKRYLKIKDIITDDDDDTIIKSFEYELIDGLHSDSKTESYKSIISKRYIPKNGDVIYFAPDCTVPRFKLKSLCDTHNISVSKTADKANTIFISPDTINRAFNYQYCLEINISCFIEIVDALFPAGTTEAIDIKTFIEDHQPEYVIFDRYLVPDPSIIMDIIHKNYKDDYGMKPYAGVYIYDTEAAQYLKFDITSDPRIHGEDQIIKFLNKENVMDRESYENVRSLFESTDKGNHMLAMEIMANCDYIKSAAYLLLLVSEYSTHMSNCASKNHVNFKSFLKFFDISVGRSFTLTDILYTLKKCKLATIDNMHFIINTKKEDLLSSETDEHFVVKNIVPNDESKAAIKESLVEEAMNENQPVDMVNIDQKVQDVQFKLV